MHEQYYFIGTGGVGKRALAYLTSLGVIKGVFDNDPQKHGKSECGFIIEPYVRQTAKGYGIVIGFFNSTEFEIELEKDGICYWTLTDFITKWHCENRKQTAIAFLDIPITSRCTLNCKHCMQYIPYRSCKTDVPIDNIRKRLDSLCHAIDFVLEASIIGGEPFLHPELAVLLRLIDREKINSIVITTNGMVIPTDDVLKACAETNVFISISDYSSTLPHISSKIDKFERAVKEKGIKCERKNQIWVAPGKFCGGGNKSKNCSRTHFQLADDQLWYCSLQCGANLSNVCCGKEKRDFIFLNQTKQLDVQKFISTHRTTVCDRCENVAGKIIPVAEQV